MFKDVYASRYYGETNCFCSSCLSVCLSVCLSLLNVHSHPLFFLEKVWRKNIYILSIGIFWIFVFDVFIHELMTWKCMKKLSKPHDMCIFSFSSWHLFIVYFCVFPQPHIPKGLTRFSFYVIFTVPYFFSKSYLFTIEYGLIVSKFRQTMLARIAQLRVWLDN